MNHQSKAAHAARHRAATAWGWVDAVASKQNHDAFKKRYGTLARKLPSYLQVNGLGQTFAFLFGKGGSDQNKPEGRLLHQLGAYLKDFARSAKNDPMEIVLALEPAAYRRATHELSALAQWIKRFAEGRLEQEQR